MADPGKGIQGWVQPSFRFGGLGTAPTVAHSDVVTSSLAGSGVATTAARSDALSASGSLPIIGEIRMFATTGAPTGWLACDGASYTTAAQPALFAVIGYAWGGAGANFNVPNLLGRAPIGAGAAGSGGLTARTLAVTVGTETVTLTTAQMPAHSHDLQRGGTGVMQSGANLGFQQGSGAGFGGSPNLTENTGGGGSHPIMQPSAAVTFIIRAL